MDVAFKKVVEHIFNNWSALQLAVDHSMGGPNSKQIAVSTVDYLVNYLTSENGFEVEDIEDVLEEIMDQEFNTVCEDDSIREVSSLMLKFLNLIKEGKMQDVEIEYNKLPPGTQWLSKAQCIQQTQPEESGESSSASHSQDENDQQNIDVPMEEVDDGWTQVKSKKRH